VCEVGNDRRLPETKENEGTARMGGVRNTTRKDTDEPRELSTRSSCAMSAHTSVGHEYGDETIWAAIGVGLQVEAEVA